MKPTRRLALTRQTLRSLSDRDLGTAAGAGPQPIASNNPQQNCQMPTPPTFLPTELPPTFPFTV